MSFVLRYVQNCIVHERFLSYTYLEKLDASAITGYILSVLTDLQLDITDCISECYDGASVMSGHCNGVSSKILEINRKAIYIHCQAHQLNLVLVDSCKKLSSASEFFSFRKFVCIHG